MKTFYAFSMVLLFWMGFPQQKFPLSGFGSDDKQKHQPQQNTAPELPAAQLASAQLVKTGTDALILVKSGANIQTIYALQEAQGRFEGFALQSANISSSNDGVTAQLSGGTTYCLGISGASKGNGCTTSLSGVGFAQIQFTKAFDYERALYLLNTYQNLVATLQHINNESNAGIAIPPRDDEELKSCAECGAGGLGSKSCSVESDTFSCSVSCNAPYYSCCSILGGCRCCK